MVSLLLPLTSSSSSSSSPMGSLPRVLEEKERKSGRWPSAAQSASATCLRSSSRIGSDLWPQIKSTTRGADAAVELPSKHFRVPFGRCKHFEQSRASHRQTIIRQSQGQRHTDTHRSLTSGSATKVGATAAKQNFQVPTQTNTDRNTAFQQDP